MSVFASVKNRFATNWKVTKLSFQTQTAEIARQCMELTPAEQASAIKAIEAMFRWQPVAQVAQAFFAAYSPGGGVAADAADLAKGGFVSGAVDLMSMQNQAAPQAVSGGMLPMQQAALSFAWIVLKSLERGGTR
jgi:hypothetical protein